MAWNESCEHGKYCFVCSCVIAEHIEILVNDENVRLRGFSHYKGYSGILIFGHCSKHIRHFDEGKLFQKTYIYLNYIYGITNSTIFGVRYESGE